MIRVHFVLILLLSNLILNGQSFQQKTINIGNLGLTLSNYGTVGQPNIRNNPSGPPSMEYPINSGIEHLFEGGIWIGALVDGQVRVSTSSVDAPTGYVSGASGFEFTAVSGLEERSTLPSSDYYRTNAVSHQDFVTFFTDSNIIIPGTSIPIQDHNYPLKSSVKLESYAWNFSFADFFVILNYSITNKSSEKWDSVYLGFWTDLVVRNVNVTQESGTSFYNKGGGGFSDSFDAVYAYEVYGDDYDYTQSYGAVQFLGIEWRNLFFHPDNKKLISDSSYKIDINANFWNFRKFDGSKYGAPSDDIQRYEKMNTGLSFPDPSLQTANNRTQLISVGPVPQILPGETVTFTIAFVCAKQLVYQQDNEESKQQLYEHCNWAKRTYLGEDLNENGLLDAGEDLNNNGKTDRYILPEPPLNPKVKIVSEDRKVDIYWDNQSVFSVDPITKKHDFEGFRLYRTKLGDDLDLSMSSDIKLIAQWDSAGNDIGYNNGFEAIRLGNPVEFDGDTTKYWFHYSLDGLLNGWQYLFVLTAFDEGDKELLLSSLETSFTENSYAVFVGTPSNDSMEVETGVYPNPYSFQAAWDGSTNRTRKLYFYNLPAECEIIIYTLSGEIVRTLIHSAGSYQGEDIQWFKNFSGSDNKVFPGGEHAWDLLSENGQLVTQGLYLYTVKNQDDGTVKNGKFAIIK